MGILKRLSNNQMIENTNSVSSDELQEPQGPALCSGASHLSAVDFSLNLQARVGVADKVRSSSFGEMDWDRTKVWGNLDTLVTFSSHTHKIFPLEYSFQKGLFENIRIVCSLFSVTKFFTHYL